MPLNVNEEIWQQVLDGEKGKGKEVEVAGDELGLEDDVFTEDEMEDEDEMEEDWEEEEGGVREFLSDDDESGDEVSDLEDLEFAEVSFALSSGVKRRVLMIQQFKRMMRVARMMKVARTMNLDRTRNGNRRRVHRSRRWHWARGKHLSRNRSLNQRSKRDVSVVSVLRMRAVFQ